MGRILNITILFLGIYLSLNHQVQALIRNEDNSIVLSDWNGDLRGNTLSDWMKHRNEYKNGIDSKANGVYESETQIEQSSKNLKKLTLNILSGLGGSDRINFEVLSDSNGNFYTRFSSIEQQKIVLVPFVQNKNKLSVSFTDHAADSEFKYGEKLEFLNEKLIYTSEFSCCKVSLGHAGCLVKGMCSNVYTFSK